MEKNKQTNKTKQKTKFDWSIKQTKIIPLQKKKIAENVFSKTWGTDTELPIEQTKDTFLHLKGHHLLTDKINNEHLRKPFFSVIRNAS